jgi:hypothetical protein
MWSNVFCSETNTATKNIIFWDIMLYSLFSPKYQLTFSGLRSIISQKTVVLFTWVWRRHVRPKHLFTFNWLYGVVNEKIVLFVSTAVRTENPTNTVHVFRCDLWLGHEKLGRSNRVTVAVVLRRLVMWPIHTLQCLSQWTWPNLLHVLLRAASCKHTDNNYVDNSLSYNSVFLICLAQNSRNRRL